MGDFLYKNEVSDNFPRKIHHNNVFECVMFVSQFHVHCKIGTLIHRITFDSISNANSCQMSAKTTRKLSPVFYSSLSTKDYLKTM